MPRSSDEETKRDQRAERNLRDGAGVPLDEASGWVECLLKGEKSRKPKAREPF